jgi:hypothetical protein
MKGHAGHSLIAHHSNLQRSALVDGGEQGNKAVDREVDMPNGFSRFVQHLPEVQSPRLKRALEPRELLLGEAGQYPSSDPSDQSLLRNSS